MLVIVLVELEWQKQNYETRTAEREREERERERERERESLCGILNRKSGEHNERCNSRGYTKGVSTRAGHRQYWGTGIS